MDQADTITWYMDDKSLIYTAREAYNWYFETSFKTWIFMKNLISYRNKYYQNLEKVCINFIV